MTATAPVALVTRPEPADGPLGAQLRRVGFTVVHVAAFTLVAADDAPGPADVAAYDWVVWTSATAVDVVAPEPGPTQHAAVGTATAHALRRHGVDATVVGDAGGESLAAALVAHLGPVAAGTRVLYPRSAQADGATAARLRAAGVVVDDPVTYRVEPADADALRAAVAAGPDVVTFASPSAVTGMADALHDDPAARAAFDVAACVSIGASTTAALTRRLRTPDATATEPTFAALADAAVAAVTGTGLQPPPPALPD